MTMSRITSVVIAVSICMRCFAATPEQLALAHDVMKAMDAEKMLDALLPQLQQMSAQVNRQLMEQNGLSNEEAAQMAKVQEKVMAVSMESIRSVLPEMERAYADTYTEAELRAMKTFYSSAEGQSMLKKQPELMRKMAPAMQDAVLATQPKIQLLIQQEVNRILAEKKKKNG